MLDVLLRLFWRGAKAASWAWPAASLLLLASGSCTEPRFVDPDEGVRVRDAGAEVRDSRPVGSASDARVGSGSDARDAGARPRDAGESERELDEERETGVGSGQSAEEQGAVQPDAGVVGTGALPVSGECALAGTYALRSDLEVEWQGRTLAGIPLVRSGSSLVQVWARVELQGQTRTTPSVLTLCGVQLPELSAGDPVILDERYGFYLPDDVWDRPGMPEWTLEWKPACADPECVLTSGVMTAPLGAEAFDPDVSNIPGALPLFPVDHDQDDLPGLSVYMRPPTEKSADGKAYSLAPLSATTPARSSHIFAAILFRAQFNATLTSCDTLEGFTNQTKITVRTVGCFARNSEGEAEVLCTAEQVGFVSDNLPAVTARPGPRLVGKRVAADADCAAIRAALPN